MSAAHDIVRGELIGKACRVIGASNPSLIGITGRIIDETSSSLMIDTPRGVKRVIKSRATFAVEIGGRWVEVRGDSIAVSPEARVKRKVE